MLLSIIGANVVAFAPKGDNIIASSEQNEEKAIEGETEQVEESYGDDDGRRRTYSGKAFGSSYRADDVSIDTIVPIGILGSGKSTFSNILALQDDEAFIPMMPQD